MLACSHPVAQSGIGIMNDKEMGLGSPLAMQLHLTGAGSNMGS